jgi:hypothetical protein
MTAAGQMGYALWVQYAHTPEHPHGAAAVGDAAMVMVLVDHVPRYRNGKRKDEPK